MLLLLFALALFPLPPSYSVNNDRNVWFVCFFFLSICQPDLEQRMSSRSLKCLVCEIFDIISWMIHRKSLYLHRVLRYVANHFKYLCKKMNFKIQRRCQNNVSNMPFYSRIVLKKRRISLGKMNQVAFLFSTRAQKQVNMPSANTTMRC